MKDLKDLKGPVVDPYFAHRVLANYKSSKQEKTIHIWKWVSGLSVALSFVLSTMFYYRSQEASVDYTKAQVAKSMVLQLNEIPRDERIAYVALEIDDGMEFVIENSLVKSKKEIILAFNSLDLKSSRLPFVFMSNQLGKKSVKIKYLDSEMNLVQEDLHHLEFVRPKT